MNDDTEGAIIFVIAFMASFVAGAVVIGGFLGHGHALNAPHAIHPLPGQTFKCGEVQVVKVDGKYVEGKACESEDKR